MRSFEATAEIDAPLAAVWSAMSDVERWPVWLPSVRGVESLDPGPFAVGARTRLRQPRLPAAVWRVTALEPGRPFAFVSRTPGTVSLGEHTREPRSLRAALEFPGRTSLEYEAGGDEAQASGPDRDRTRTTVELTLWTAEQGGRRTPVTRSPRYRPHLVLGDPPPRRAEGDGLQSPEEHDIGVQLTGAGEPLTPGVKHVVEWTLPYDVDASARVPGASFTLRAGPTVVGHGRVLDR